ncbi:MAG: hydantoinase/oxoprolinase family protein [Thermoleophilia bacterium]|nr:hydantoinase/oxoprolinase family protein [Thermoleophilia bacterium]
MGITVGIDTGGTFTDLVAVDEATGRWHVAKVPSNPENPVSAIDASLHAAGFDPADVSFVVVGTTIGINAVLTRRGARVMYLTTEGFEDVLHIQRINRKHHYDFHWRKPTPLAHRPDCIGVRERLDEEGRVLEPIDLEALARSIEDVLENGGEQPAVAVCFLFSYLNPEHELAARALLTERFPQLTVSLSHEVAPIWREYERGTTVTVDAYLKPLFEQYVDGVSDALEGNGTGGQWALLKSNGGHALADEARGRPAHLLLSGIAGGAIGGAYAARTAGTPQAIALDMGGTSCDVCLVVNGEALYSSDFEIEFGFPVSVPSVSTQTIGAGGGSIGWVDPGGFLQVGPQSAGAVPGPACYAQGGESATITDADVVLGRLDPSFFLGGQMSLDPERSRAVLDDLGRLLGLDRIETASAMVRICNENMANAIRIVTVEQGIDPRDFALVAFGGAGATHACEIADAINMRRVVVPPRPGLCSAFGALAASVRVDAVRSVYLTDRTTPATALDTLFHELEAQALFDVAAQGLAQQPSVRRFIAMRYQGQNYEQEVAVPTGTVDEAALAELYSGYGRLYEEFYGYRLDGIPIELVRLSVVAMGEPPAFASLPTEEAEGEGPERRDVFFPGSGFVATDIVRCDRLAPAETRLGPVIVESMDSTVVVPPGWTLSASPTGILDLTRA